MTHTEPYLKHSIVDNPFTALLVVLPNKHCCHCRPKVIVAGRTDHTGALWVLSSRSRCGNAGRDATKRVVPLSSTPRLPREVGARALGALHPTGLAKLGLR